MITLKYRISDSICTTLEALQTEISNITNVMIFLIRNNPDDKNICLSEVFKKYENEYIKKFTEYDFAIDIISEMIPGIFSKYMISWLVEYESKTLEIKFQEEILNKYSWEDILCEMKILDIGEG